MHEVEDAADATVTPSQGPDTMWHTRCCPLSLCPREKVRNDADTDTRQNESQGQTSAGDGSNITKLNVKLYILSKDKHLCAKNKTVWIESSIFPKI